MKTSDTFGRRVGLGFLIVVITLAVSVSLSLWKVSSNTEVNLRVNNLRTPTVKASLEALTGLNHTMSAIRGFTLFKETKYKVERDEGWQKIDESGQILVSLAEERQDPKHLQRAQRLINRMAEVRRMQDRVEELAGSRPKEAMALLGDRVTPLTISVRDEFEKLVEDEEVILRQDIQKVEQNSRELVVLEWLILGLGLLIATLTGIVITRNVTKPMEKAVEASNRLSDGDFDFQVSLAGPLEIELLGHTLEQMRGNLKKLTEGLKEKNTLLENHKWLIDGQVGLLEQMTGNLTTKSLANEVLTFLCRKVDAVMGAFYLFEDDELKPVAGYAHDGALNLNRSYKISEGLVGQAAKEAQLRVVRDLPSDYFKVQSGLGGTLPRTIAMVPAVHDGQVSGVVELASLEDFSESKLAFLETVSRNIGIALNLSIASQKTKELLEETQAQAEELQVQQEELKVANEELEQNTRALQASEEELRTQQEQLRSTNEELEEQTQLLEREKETLAGRTEELLQTQQKLQTRAKEVEQVSRYKSEFLANMSHELRTPLNSILMLSQSLAENRSNNLTERQAKAVETIHSSGADLLTLIEDILDLSKVEAGKLEVKPEDISMRELFESMQMSFEPMAREAKLEFQTEIASDLPNSFYSDSTRVKQILKNLLSNAFKFTNEGSVKLAAFRPEAQSNFSLVREGLPCLCFSVVDTGIGIPQSEIKKVFDAFKQLDAKTTRKYGGTGLGLSIVRELVGLLGGEIAMKSEDGKGTTVTVCLPEDLSAIARDKNPQAKNSIDDVGEDRASLRVLNPKAQIISVDDDREALAAGDSVVFIVEDDLRFANSLLDLCRENGFKGVVISDGVSAVKLAEELLPQGILLDLSLPELDGSDVIKLLKENPRTRHIPIQVITGHDRKNEVLTAGAIGFLKKPATSDDLNQVLKNLRNYSTEKGKRLLIVEDDEAQRRGIREFIELPGIEILEAASGKEGLELLKQGDISCIVLDLKLPDMEGKEFLSISRKLYGDALPPVIIYTGRDIDDAELKELKRETQSIIVKSAKAPERLFDEAMMFLHRLQKDLPGEKQKIIENLHDPTRILKGKSVLVVDDDPRNILSLSHLLEDHGVTVYEAENGKAALEWLDQRGPSVDLVLMDMMMPEMDGYEATRAIRKKPTLKSIPVIALTARAMKGERERCLEAGCDDYLSKPIDNDKLISLLRVWLYRSA